MHLQERASHWGNEVGLWSKVFGYGAHARCCLGTPSRADARGAAALPRQPEHPGGFATRILWCTVCSASAHGKLATIVLPCVTLMCALSPVAHRGQRSARQATGSGGVTWVMPRQV